LDYVSAYTCFCDSSMLISLTSLWATTCGISFLVTISLSVHGLSFSARYRPRLKLSTHKRTIAHTSYHSICRLLHLPTTHRKWWAIIGDDDVTSCDTSSLHWFYCSLPFATVFNPSCSSNVKVLAVLNALPVDVSGHGLFVVAVCVPGRTKTTVARACQNALCGRVTVSYATRVYVKPALG
jgi:hypothetical protein